MVFFYHGTVPALYPISSSGSEVDLNNFSCWGDKPFIFSNLKIAQGLAEITEFVVEEGMLGRLQRV